jgi:hypothetical protein
VEVGSTKTPPFVRCRLFARRASVRVVSSLVFRPFLVRVRVVVVGVRVRVCAVSAFFLIAVRPPLRSVSKSTRLASHVQYEQSVRTFV